MKDAPSWEECAYINTKFFDKDLEDLKKGKGKKRGENNGSRRNNAGGARDGKARRSANGRQENKEAEIDTTEVESVESVEDFGTEYVYDNLDLDSMFGIEH